jgi:hypothetical protein
MIDDVGAKVSPKKAMNNPKPTVTAMELKTPLMLLRSCPAYVEDMI